MTGTGPAGIAERDGGSLGLAGATAVGVGAIVGGGILALAGTAFEHAGPGAILAFALNGVIAVVTALSFSELASRFPESGGTYTFARRVLSVEAAFVVGWIVWFASIVAAALYAIGFAVFAIAGAGSLLVVLDVVPPGWISTPEMAKATAVAATGVGMVQLLRRPSGGGQWINWLKVAVFAVLIAGGLVATLRLDPAVAAERMSPFLPKGTVGLIQAMGFCFIALQGFDLIAAVGGEVRDPSRTLPRAMLLSLAIALAVYLPLLGVVSIAGVGEGETIVSAAAADPETVVARAALRFLGPTGYWLVIVAGVLAMYSALQANLFAASRVAHAMARNRTLHRSLEAMDARHGTPTRAIATTGAIVFVVLFLLRDVSAAGAAASLIFLVTFALAHGLAIIARRRGGSPERVFRTPWFPALPVGGAIACVALALFQGIDVPRAGAIAGVWIVIGLVLFVALFGRSAAVADAASEARDPELLRLRGRSPLVLVPIANADHAAAMVDLAAALAPPWAGRVLVLSVAMSANEEDAPGAVARAQEVVRRALAAGLDARRPVEALVTLSADPWAEIGRVARAHRCESLLLGLTGPERLETDRSLERLLAAIDGHAVVLRAPEGWRLAAAQRVLVPVAGRGRHAALRARLIAGLARDADRTITYLRVVPRDATEERVARVRAVLERVAREEAHAGVELAVVRGDDPIAAVAEAAADADLVVLGTQRRGRVEAFGRVARALARDVACGVLLVSER